MRTHLAVKFLAAVAMALAPALDLSGVGNFSGVRFSAAAAGGKGGISPGSSAGGAAQAAAKAAATAAAKAGSNSGAGGKNYGTSIGSGVAGAKVGGASGNSAAGAAKAAAKAPQNSGAVSKIGHKGGGKPAGSGGGAASSKGKTVTAVSGALPSLAVGPGSLKGSVTPKSVPAGKIVAVAPATGAPPSIRLPFTLWPLKALGERGEYKQGISGYAVTDPMTTGAISDDRDAVVRVCLQAITSAALPLGAVRLRAASAGPLVTQRGGALTAPIAVRIEYASQGRMEIRQARVRCHLDRNGVVLAVT